MVCKELPVLGKSKFCFLEFFGIFSQIILLCAWLNLWIWKPVREGPLCMHIDKMTGGKMLLMVLSRVGGLHMRFKVFTFFFMFLILHFYNVHELFI